MSAAPAPAPLRHGRRPRLLFLVASDWYFLCHRLSLGLAAQAAGYDVTIVTPKGPYTAQIEAAGLRHVPLAMDRQGRNPLSDLDTIRRLVELYRRERPDVVHHVAIKPMIYGTVAAKAARVPAIVNAMPGMGYVFLNKDPLSRAIRVMVETSYKALLTAPNTRTILQNPDDLEKWIAWGVMRRDRVVLIRGAGVDTARFAPAPEPEGPCFVVLPARLLKDKGVREFVEAARTLRAEGVPARFGLVGEPDLGNPASITPAEVAAWVSEGLVETLGWRDDMDRVHRDSHVTCLPSYGEGLPKALLEAAAAGRAIVSTDVPGCREVARHDENALLVPPRDAAALTAALRRVILDKELRQRLGARGREIALADFDQRQVARATLGVYAELLAQVPA
jgi:glycosyltransferase involved in cell wall biosynthesis